jgi:hypothetical protein
MVLPGLFHTWPGPTDFALRGARRRKPAECTTQYNSLAKVLRFEISFSSGKRTCELTFNCMFTLNKFEFVGNASGIFSGAHHPNG